jgi:hypothetical protein
MLREPGLLPQQLSKRGESNAITSQLLLPHFFQIAIYPELEREYLESHATKLKSQNSPPTEPKHHYMVAGGRESVFKDTPIVASHYPFVRC